MIGREVHNTMPSITNMATPTWLTWETRSSVLQRQRGRARLVGQPECVEKCGALPGRPGALAEGGAKTSYAVPKPPARLKAYSGPHSVGRRCPRAGCRAEMLAVYTCRAQTSEEFGYQRKYRQCKKGVSAYF